MRVEMDRRQERIPPGLNPDMLAKRLPASQPVLAW
jgi:hypothetical protein